MNNIRATKLLIFKIAVLAFTLTKSFATEQCIVSEFDKVSEAVKNCNTIIISNLKVPGGEQLVLHLNAGTTVIFRGNTSFGYHEWTGPLVSLTGTNITVKGEEGSILDGQGPFYWDGFGTHLNNNKPRFFRISVSNAILENIIIRNCPVLCILIRSSDNLIVRNWKIDNLDGEEGTAPVNKTAHNTDGFNMEGVNNTLIENSVVYNQDDCVVVASGNNVTVRNILCVGSHGLSVRGVGATLKDVTFEDSILLWGENGIHLKTTADGGPGLITNVTYRNIFMQYQKNYGINVQQNYNNGIAKLTKSADSKDIPIYNLQMHNVTGEVLEGAVPVFIFCRIGECLDWTWDQIDISGTANDNCTNYIPEGYDC